MIMFKYRIGYVKLRFLCILFLSIWIINCPIKCQASVSTAINNNDNELEAMQPVNKSNLLDRLQLKQERKQDGNTESTSQIIDLLKKEKKKLNRLADKQTDSEHFLSVVCNSNKTEKPDICDHYVCNLKGECICKNSFVSIAMPVLIGVHLSAYCVPKMKYKEQCFLDEQCNDNHQHCLMNSDQTKLDLEKLINKIHQTYSKLGLDVKNNTKNNATSSQLIQMYQFLYSDSEWLQSIVKHHGKCDCKTSYFYNYFLSVTSDKHTRAQLNKLILEHDQAVKNKINKSNKKAVSDDLFARDRQLLVGECLKIRKINETCSSNIECQMNDLHSICKKSKCKCKKIIGNQLQVGIQSNNQTESTSAKCALTSFNLSLDIGSNIVKTLETGSKIEFESSKSDLKHSTFQGQDRNHLNRNCSNSEIYCLKSRRCLRRTAKRHFQQNLASMVWTLLCLLTFVLVFTVVFVKNRKQLDDPIDHNYQDFFLRASTLSLNNSTNFFSNLFNRSNHNQRNIELANERHLMGRTPPPDFNDIMDDPPTYEEAVMMLQKINVSS